MTRQSRPKLTRFLIPLITALAVLGAGILAAEPSLAQSVTPQQGNVAGGSTHVNGGLGFACANGTYEVINGFARCTTQIGAPVSAPASGCAATAVSQGACAFNLPSSTSGSTPSVANTVAGYTGVAAATCTNGTWGPTSASCTPKGCASAVATFGACSFTFAPLTSGQSSTATTSTASYNGAATATCQAGALTLTAQSCTPTAAPTLSCKAWTLSWGAGCSAAVSQTSAGQSVSLRNESPSYSGSATFTCSAEYGSRLWGTWLAASNATCTQGCDASTQSWTGAHTVGHLGSSCTGLLSASASGSSQAVANTNSASSGSATFSCSNGVWTMTQSACSAAQTPGGGSGGGTVTLPGPGSAGN